MSGSGSVDRFYRKNVTLPAIPSVAESVDISPDGLKYVFHLKKTYWSNGDPVTACDFEYAWKWKLTPKNPSLYIERLYVIKNERSVHEDKMAMEWLGIYAMDSNTLVVELEEPCPYFLELLGQLSLSFYPIHCTHPESTNGPFVLEKYIPNTYLKLMKNETYWDAAQVKLEGVNITFVEDDSTELYLYEKGELDWAGQPLNGGLPIDVLNNLPNVHKVPTKAIFFYSFNVTHPLLKNKKVRQALSLSVDRQQIVDYITRGGDAPAYTFVLQEKPSPVPSDTELLALFEQGWEETGRPPLTFTLSCNVAESDITVAQFVQARWTNLFGINVTLVSSEWKAHLHNLSNGLFDCARCSWRTFVNDPVPLLELFENPMHPMQHTNWNHPRFIESFRNGRKSRNQQVRKNFLQEAVAIFDEETPVVPLFYFSLCYVKNPKLKGEVITSIGLADFKWAYFEK